MDNEALFKIGYGLYVLTAKDNDKDNGCIINSITQVTSDVPIFVVGVNKQNFTHDMIIKTKQFNISVLTTEAPFEVFKHFGFETGKNTDKFAKYTGAEYAENGISYLSKYTNAYISFEVLDTIDFVTHTLFKAKVTNAKQLSDAESVTYNYYQSYIKPKPAETNVKGWRCSICGYVYEGENLPADFICPLCKHGASDFVKIGTDE